MCQHLRRKSPRKRTCRSCRTRVSALKVDELDRALHAPIQHVVWLDVAVNEVKLLVQDAECLQLIVNVANQSLVYNKQCSHVALQLGV